MVQGNNQHPRYDFLDQESRFKAGYIGNIEGKLSQVVILFTMRHWAPLDKLWSLQFEARYGKTSTGIVFKSIGLGLSDNWLRRNIEHTQLRLQT